MLPRASIVTSRLTRTRFRASARDPGDKLTETIAGSSWGVIPIAIARLNRNASSKGRDSATLITKMEIVSTPATLTRKPEVAQVNLERGVRLTFAQTQGDGPEGSACCGGDNDSATRALAHHRTHERTRRQVDRGVGCGDRLQCLGRCHRFAGEDSLIALELVGLDDPKVSWHHAADPQRHYITGTSGLASTAR